MFVILIGDVYIVGRLGNATLQADCFNPCYWPAVCAAERSKRTLASGLPITRASGSRRVRVMVDKGEVRLGYGLCESYTAIVRYDLAPPDQMFYQAFLKH